MTAINPAVSPCRRHPCSVEHAERVRGWREHVAIWEARAESETGGYAGDLAMYVQSNPRPQFKDWLIQTRSPR